MRIMKRKKQNLFSMLPRLNVAVFMLLALLLLSSSAQAYSDHSSVPFTVQGKIESASCNIAILPSSAINLGTVGRDSLNGAAGTSSAPKQVSLQFSNCDAGLTAAKMTFSGEPYDPSYPMIYKNDYPNSADAASGVGLQLQSLTDAASLGPNDIYEINVDDANVSTFSMLARMYAPYGIVSAGKFSATVTFNVTYK